LPDEPRPTGVTGKSGGGTTGTVVAVVVVATVVGATVVATVVVVAIVVGGVTTTGVIAGDGWATTMGDDDFPELPTLAALPSVQAETSTSNATRPRPVAAVSRAVSDRVPITAKSPPAPWTPQAGRLAA